MPETKPKNDKVAKKRKAKKSKQKKKLVKEFKYNGETKAQIKKDPRFSKNVVSSSTNPIADAQNLEVSLDVPIDPNVFLYVASSYIMFAYQKGYIGTVESTGFIAFALNYLANFLVSAAQGAVPQLSKIPYWLLCLSRAIAPKTAKTGMGKTSYRFNTAILGVDYQPTDKLVGNGTYNSNWYCWQPVSGVPVDGFPLQGPIFTTAQPYTDKLGADAVSTIFEYMENQKFASDNNRMVGIGTKTPWDNDVSAFSFQIQRMGGGAGGQGGFSNLVCSEAPLMNPILGVLVAQTEINQQNPRFAAWINSGGGDPAYLGGILSAGLPSDAWSYKKHPKFKPIDFWKVVDIYCTWLTLVIQTYVNSPEFGTNINIIADSLANDPVEVAAYIAAQVQPTLTFWEIVFLLRNVCMWNFSDTQPMVQFLYPRSPENTNDNQFTPLLAGTNTCYVGGGGLAMPEGLVENLRALTFRFTFDPKKPNGNPTLWVPVLGVYAQQTNVGPQNYNFAVNFNSQSVTIPTFNPTERFFKKEALKTSKGTDVKLVKVASNLSDVSVIDGSINGNPNVIVEVNNSQRLNDLVQIFNPYPTDLFAAYTMSVKTFSKDGGLRPLLLITETDCIINNADTITATMKKKIVPEKVGDFVDTRIEGMKKRVGSMYEDQQVVARTSYGPMLNAAESYAYMLRPDFYAAINASDYLFNNSFNKIQTFLEETNSRPYNDGVNAVFYKSFIDTFAAAMTKAPTSPENDLSRLLAEMSKEGRSDILSSIGNIMTALAPAAGALFSML